MKFYVLLAGALCLSQLCLINTAAAQLVFEETFDQNIVSELKEKLIAHKLLELVPKQGTHQSNGLKATYKSYPRGSERIVVRYPFGESGMEYTLLFDVKFDKDFQFVKGGKLHGLGPKYPITGGNTMKPKGWSARMMFHKHNSIQTYIYCQNKKSKWGATSQNPKFKFEKDRYYAISYHVRLNDLGKANGFAHIYIDGHPIIQHEGIEYRGSDDPATLISQFLFSTFHGGHTPDWAPKDAEGNFKDVYIYYDNFAVVKGIFVKDKIGSIKASQ